MVRRFTTSRAAVLILSYETFRIHEKLFHRGQHQCDLLICDEAHRLKNKDTKTAVALSALQTRRRVLLSGTPIQNDLDEFYSMVHFANPGLLGSEKDFHRLYQNPILRGREPDASDKDRARGEAKTPDALLLVPLLVRGRAVNWIDSKATFGDPASHDEYEDPREIRTLKVNRIKNYWMRNNAFYGVNAIFDIELTKDKLEATKYLTEGDPDDPWDVVAAREEARDPKKLAFTEEELAVIFPNDKTTMTLGFEVQLNEFNMVHVKHEIHGIYKVARDIDDGESAKAKLQHIMAAMLGSAGTDAAAK